MSATTSSAQVPTNAEHYYTKLGAVVLSAIEDLLAIEIKVDGEMVPDTEQQQELADNFLERIRQDAPLPNNVSTGHDDHVERLEAVTATLTAQVTRLARPVATPRGGATAPATVTATGEETGSRNKNGELRKLNPYTRLIKYLKAMLENKDEAKPLADLTVSWSATNWKEDSKAAEHHQLSADAFSQLEGQTLTVGQLTQALWDLRQHRSEDGGEPLKGLSHAATRAALVWSGLSPDGQAAVRTVLATM